MTRALILSLAAGAALEATPLATLAGSQECFADWSVAAPIVRKETLATVEEVAKLARSKLTGEIVKTTLCRNKEGEYVYRLLVKDPKGHFRNVTVDGRKPFDR